MIESGDRFRLDLADDVAPGTYGFICTLHPSSMFGTFEVVEPGTEIAAPAEVRAQGESDLSEVHAAMAEAAQRLSAQTGTFVQAGEVAGGAVPPYSINVFPSQVSVPAGETVTWEVHGAHMFTFNPPEDEPLFVTLERGDDGIVRPTANDYEAPGPGQPGMPAEFTLDPVSIDGGEFDGASYLHSGLLWGRIGPLPPMEYSLTFTEPGTYTYYCLRHPGMVGTVEVTG
jgi:plastocyanin